MCEGFQRGIILSTNNLQVYFGLNNVVKDGFANCLAKTNNMRRGMYYGQFKGTLSC